MKLVMKTSALLAFLTLCHCAIAAPPSALDLVGTYRLESMTTHGQIAPTNFNQIAITLNADGSFVTTNVPPDFFFEAPSNSSLAITQGTWEEKQAAGTGVLFLNFPTASGFNACMLPIKSDFGTLRICKVYHVGKPDSAEVYLGTRSGETVSVSNISR
jgi:hypothetical protein